MIGFSLPVEALPMDTETFQHYRILRRDDGKLWELGRGAMAVTYKAFDVNLCCPVALKVVSSLQLEDEHTRARFIREARAAAALRHRNIASVYHLGNDEQSYFYAMEFVDGETVADLVVRRGPLPPGEALGIAAQVARALGAAAKQGLVHRDIKPANLMVVQEDDDEEDALVVKVIDFGLARRAVTDASAQITLSGFVGTPQYASPEQVAERDLDTRSDIYSLGVTLWYMLAGEPPFTGPAARIGAQHLNNEPPWVLVADLPEPVRALLAHLLQKNPADRPQDPSALRREIESCREALRVLEADPCATTMPPPARKPLPETAENPADSDEPAHPPTVTAAEAETMAPAAPDLQPEGPPPEAGELFAERYALLEFAGEGRAGRVFRARDDRAAGRAVAVKILRPESPLSPLELHSLKGDFRRLRAAPHPHLVEVFALDQTRGYRYVASEWVNGFTLVDLLRHRGRLELREALHLFEHVSDAAAHASANGLRRLELAPHQIFVHFPAAFDGDRARTVRSIIDRPLERWPAFGLKINALAPVRETGRVPTWAGAMTLVPSARAPEHGGAAGGSSLSADNYLHALGALLYEMLSGTPPPSDQENGREAPPLPTLGEEANDLLQRALSTAPGFRDEREFFNALLAASGLERANLRFEPEATQKADTRVATDATIVPPAVPPVPGLAEKLSPPLVATLRMAPPIRTKLLRPRVAAPAAGTVPRSAGAGGVWSLVTAVALGLIVAALVLGAVLWAKHLPPFLRRTSPNASPTGSP